MLTTPHMPPPRGYAPYLRRQQHQLHVLITSKLQQHLCCDAPVHGIHEHAVLIHDPEGALKQVLESQQECDCCVRPLTTCSGRVGQQRVVCSLCSVLTYGEIQSCSQQRWAKQHQMQLQSESASTPCIPNCTCAANVHMLRAASVGHRLALVILSLANQRPQMTMSRSLRPPEGAKTGGLTEAVQHMRDTAA